MLLQSQAAGAAIEVIGFLDENFALLGQTLQRIGVLGTFVDVANMLHEGVIVAIGDNRQWCLLCDQVRQQGEQVFLVR